MLDVTRFTLSATCSIETQKESETVRQDKHVDFVPIAMY